ncbi:MAG: CDP-glucose 4,6-dehydratase [Clostridiales bacterium]|nr:CDP-glucose 4,6-dehydratase [Clostridiales bacterium]
MSTKGFWLGKRVFVTGHTGFKGSWLCKILETLGAKTVGYALEPPAGPNLYNICKPNIDSIIGDIRDFDKLSAAYKAASPEIVIHMAAQPLVLQSYKEPKATYETNVMGTVNILECIRLFGAVSALNVTTDKVYLNHERLEGYGEDEQLDGHDPYSNSKSCSELVTASYNRSYFKSQGVKTSTARSGNVIGGGDFAENRLIPDCARAAAKNETIIIRNPDSIRPYQHVLDTLFAYLLILEKQYNCPEVAGNYNIGPEPGGCVSSGRLADLFCEGWGGLKWGHLPIENNHESGLLTLNTTKIKNILGWAPFWDIRESVNAAVDWYKEYNYGSPNSVMSCQIEKFVRLGI